MRRYQDFALEDALKQSELPIGNNIHLRPPTRPGVVLIENVSRIISSDVYSD